MNKLPMVGKCVRCDQDAHYVAPVRGKLQPVCWTHLAPAALWASARSFVSQIPRAISGIFDWHSTSGGWDLEVHRAARNAIADSDREALRELLSSRGHDLLRANFLRPTLVEFAALSDDEDVRPFRDLVILLCDELGFAADLSDSAAEVVRTLDMTRRESDRRLTQLMTQLQVLANHRSEDALQTARELVRWYEDMEPIGEHRRQLRSHYEDEFPGEYPSVKSR